MTILRLLTWSLIVLWSLPAWATTYYVATTGSNANSCVTAQNISTPKQTIVNGITCLAAGDTLLIRGGTYSGERINDASGPIPGGTTYANATLLKPYPSETVTMSGAVQAMTFGASALSHYIIIGDPAASTFTLVLTGQTNACVGADASAGLAHHIRWVNVECKNAAISGVIWGIANVDTFYEWIGGSSHDNGSTPNQDHGFYIQSGSNVIDGADVYKNCAEGVQTFNSASLSKRANNNIIRNSKWHNNGGTTSIPSCSGSAVGILLGSGTGNTAYNNLVYSNKNGIQVGYRCTNCTVYNNTIYNNTPGNAIQVAVDLLATTSGTILRNNILWSNSGDIIEDHGSGTVSSNNLFGTDPLFLSAAGGNFHLQGSSPAINFGLNLTSLGITTDFDGSLRPQTGAWTAGAYVLSGPSPDSLAPTNPTNLTVLASNLFGRLDLAWTASTDNVAVLDYWVERCAGAGCASFLPVTSLVWTVLADTGLAPSTSYSYRVKARDTSSNFSTYSSEVSAITAPVNFHLSLNMRRVSTNPADMLPAECLTILSQEPIAPKAPTSMTAGQWREFEYTWMKWCNRKLDAC